MVANRADALEDFQWIGGGPGGAVVDEDGVVVACVNRDWVLGGGFVVVVLLGVVLLPAA